jgi:deazaflavin-dependent oxidoreductase (nitroreductase family)
VPPLPPRLFARAAWAAHRAMYRVTGRRRGLWRPTDAKWGAMRLRTTGRRSGRERAAILAYLEDGDRLFTLAMNGWAPSEPAWWLNLQAEPDAVAELVGETRPVRARAAEGAERDQLWARMREVGDDIDGYALRRPGRTAVVVLERRAAS